MIEVHELTKKYGTGDNAVTAIDHVTFTVRPGVVTGFLGPNGAGKSTTMRSSVHRLGAAGRRGGGRRAAAAGRVTGQSSGWLDRMTP